MLRGSSSGSAAGPGSDEGALARAASLRFPDLTKLNGRAKIDALIDHITETAILRSQLEELRLEAQVNARTARDELSRVQAGIGKTRGATEELRRAARPDLARVLDGALWLVDRCTEQIARMGGSEYDFASRTYTMLSN